MTLPDSFFTRPISHRGLHDRAAGRVENSMKSFQAALDGNYGIELDLQCSSDGQAMVFHDDLMDRLTGATGPVRARSQAELGTVPLTDDGGTIRPLSEVLELVNGQVPLLIEIKDQDGAMGPNVGTLEQATATALQGYKGDVAVMSFNPHAVAAMAKYAPHIPRGIVTSAYVPTDWPDVPVDRGNELRLISDYDRTGSCFISHEAADLDRPRVAELKQAGAHILCWTIKSPKAEAEARRIVDNVTFEGYLA